MKKQKTDTRIYQKHYEKQFPKGLEILPISQAFLLYTHSIPLMYTPLGTSTFQIHIPHQTTSHSHHFHSYFGHIHHKNTFPLPHFNSFTDGGLFNFLVSAQTHSPTPGQNEKLDGNNYRKLLSPKSISLQIQESSQIRKLHKTPPTQINFQFT